MLPKFLFLPFLGLLVTKLARRKTFSFLFPKCTRRARVNPVPPPRKSVSSWWLACSWSEFPASRPPSVLKGGLLRRVRMRPTLGENAHPEPPPFPPGIKSSLPAEAEGSLTRSVSPVAAALHAGEGRPSRSPSWTGAVWGASSGSVWSCVCQSVDAGRTRFGSGVPHLSRCHSERCQLRWQFPIPELDRGNPCSSSSRCASVI